MAASTRNQRRFVVATPQRSVCDNYARVLDEIGALRMYALGTRRGTPGISPEVTRLNTLLGLMMYVTSRTLPLYQGESVRFRLGDVFDRWLRRHLRHGDILISAPGYVPRCAEWLRENGGLTLLDCGNSHPNHFWKILEPEYRAFKTKHPPIAFHHIRRCNRTIAAASHFLSPSQYVTQSFLAEGITRILPTSYPVDLGKFKPRGTPPDPAEPLTVVSTGSVSLRKGYHYLLDAFRIIRQTHPDARLLLTDSVHESMAGILRANADLPIDWAPPLPHDQLAERLRGAHVYALLSLEEGLARTALEAMACGLPVVVTPNTGANDFVQPGVNGEIIPLRDAQAAADAILACHRRLLTAGPPPRGTLEHDLSYGTFRTRFLQQMEPFGLTP